MVVVVSCAFLLSCVGIVVYTVDSVRRNALLLMLSSHAGFRKENVDQLGKVISVLGTVGILLYIAKCNVEPTQEIDKAIAKYTQ